MIEFILIRLNLILIDYNLYRLDVFNNLKILFKDELYYNFSHELLSKSLIYSEAKVINFVKLVY